jgi:hypothetical protein
MGIVEDVADELAKISLEILNKDSDDAFVQQVADAIGGSSQTMEEAYSTAVRVRRAEQRARVILDKKLAEVSAKDD